MSALPTLEVLKYEARALRAEAAASGRSLTQSAALEQVARRHGLRDWNTAAALARRNVGTVLRRFPVQRVVLVADRGLLSQENIGELTALADRDGRKLAFILAVPARRNAELAETFQELDFDADGLAEAGFAGHRLIVAHDPLRAGERSDRRRARIRDLGDMAERLAGKLDSQEFGPDRAAANPPGGFGAERTDGPGRPRLRPRGLQPLHPRRRRSRAHPLHQARPAGRPVQLEPRRGGHCPRRTLRRQAGAAKGHSAGPRSAPDLPARIQKHTTHIGDQTFTGLSRSMPEQLDPFEALGLPRPA